MIKKVGVIGAGIMGHGIAELCAVSGCHVILNDVNDEILSKALEKMKWSLERLSKRGELGETAEAVMNRVATSTEISDLKESDLVIEAVKEKTEIKRQVLTKVGSTVRKDCIISSNTSTIPISELAEMTGRPEKFIGIHFSNPPMLMPIIEIIRGERTEDSTLNATRDFVVSLGKDFVVANKDVPGFIINRINDRSIMESMVMLEEGTSVAVLDAMIRFRLGFPMGMCELLDFVGIDTVYNANREMVKRGFNSTHSGILREKVESGKLGSKTGEGFYRYPKMGEYSRPAVLPDDDMYRLNPLRILAAAANEAAWLVRNDVCTRFDVEKAMKMAMNWPHGPLEYADRYGIDRVIEVLRERWADSGESRYTPDALLVDMEKKHELGRKTGKGFQEWSFDETDFGPIHYVKMDDCARVEMNRPGKLNSLDEASWKGLRDALTVARDDDGVRSVVITGRGRAFCAGDDIDMMHQWQGAGDAKAWMTEFAEPLIDLLAGYPKPLISAVNGVAFGGGSELNMFFDIVIASDQAVFSLPEGLIGAFPPIASSYGFSMISRKFGRYALTGEWFSAEQARDMGLVDIIVPPGQIDIAVAEFAEKVARLAPLSSKSVKSTINLSRQVFAGEAKYGSNELVILSSSRDFAEGQDAFMHKRSPSWEGR